MDITFRVETTGTGCSGKAPPLQQRGPQVPGSTMVEAGGRVTFRCSGDGLRKAYRASDWHSRSSVRRCCRDTLKVTGQHQLQLRHPQNRRPQTTSQSEQGYLEEGVELSPAPVQELLVNGLEGKFAERR